MSYILDALKKAEAERRIGVPAGMPATHTVPMTPTTRQAAIWRTPWPWAAVTAIASLLIGFTWWQAASSKAPQQIQQIQTSSPPPAPPVQTLATMSPPAPPPSPIVEMEEKPKPPEPKSIKPKEKKRAMQDEPKKAEEPPIATLRELPNNIQREIPQLSVGGYIYAGNKADRSVLINGRLLREGEEIASGFTLEKMMPNGMVLNYKGYRYRTSY